MIRIHSLIRFSKILDSDQSTDLLDQNIPLSGLNRVRLYPDYGGIILLEKCEDIPALLFTSLLPTSAIKISWREKGLGKVQLLKMFQLKLSDHKVMHSASALRLLAAYF